MRLTNEAEYQEYSRIHGKAEGIACILWRFKHPGQDHLNTQFWGDWMGDKRATWEKACEILQYINGEDAAEAAELCAEYRANPRFNPDPSDDFKNSLPY